MNLVFDLETDGLLNNFTCIHCLCIHDLDEAKTYTFNDQGSQEPIVKGVEMLADADVVIGHNVLHFDVPVIKRIYPWFVSPYMVDTLLCSRIFHPNILDIDKRRQWKLMPINLYGRHSLKAYGYRLGVYKDSFGEDTDWKFWSPEMEAYMEQDVVVTTKLWHHFETKYLNS
nr:hypothetical protein 9 [bacterium]